MKIFSLSEIKGTKSGSSGKNTGGVMSLDEIKSGGVKPQALVRPSTASTGKVQAPETSARVQSAGEAAQRQAARETYALKQYQDEIGSLSKQVQEGKRQNAAFKEAALPEPVDVAGLEEQMQKRIELANATFESLQKSRKASLESVQEQPDFWEKAQTGAQLGSNVWTEYGEIANPVSYAAANESTLRALAQNNWSDVYRDDLYDLYRYTFLEPEEQQVYNYYRGAGDEEGAQAYLEAMDRILNQRVTQATQEKIKQDIEEGGAAGKVRGVVQNIASGFISPLGTVEAVRQNAANAATGSYAPIDVNSPAFRGQQVAEASQEALTGDIGNPVVKFLADTGLSIGQNAARYPFGGAGLAMMGLGASGSTAYEAAKNGASAKQALELGIVAGLAETATEKLPMDEFFGVLKGAPVGLKQSVKNVLKQAKVEFSEELLSEYLNRMADNALRGDASDMESYIQQLMQEGMSREDAETAARVEFYIKRPLLAGFGGALSGGVMGGAANIYANTAGVANLGKSLMADDQQLNVIDRGLRRIPGTGSQRLAQTLDQAWETNRQVGAYPLGRLALQTEADLAQEFGPSRDSEAVRETFRVLPVPQTMDELSRKPDVRVVDISGGHAKSKKSLVPEAEAKGVFDGPVVNRDTGRPVFMTKDTYKHSYNNANEENIAAASYIPEILQNAVLTHKQVDTHPDSRADQVYVFFAAVRDKNGISPVTIKVKEYDTDNVLNLPKVIQNYFAQEGSRPTYATEYDNKVLVVEDIEKVGELQPSSQRHFENQNTVLVQSQSPTTISIRDLTDLVNDEARKYLPNGGDWGREEIQAEDGRGGGTPGKMDRTQEGRETEDTVGGSAALPAANATGTEEDANGMYRTPRELIRLSNQQYNQQQLVRRLERFAQLTEQEKWQVNEVARGFRSLESLQQLTNKAEMVELAEAKLALRETERVLNWNRREQKNRKLNQAEDVLGDLIKYKEKRTLGGARYNRETAERIFEDIAPDRATAERLKETYARPVHQNEARNNRWKKTIKDMVAALNIGTKNEYVIQRENIPGLQKGQKVSESALVQLYGEKLIGTLEMAEMGADAEKITKAAETFRAIYDESIDMINQALVANGYRAVGKLKDYFPHFNDRRGDRLLDRLAQALNIEIDTDQIPTSIAGMTHTFRPGKQFFGNLLRREGDTTTYNALEGLDRYLQGAGNVIWHTDDVQRWRALEDTVRYELSDEGVQEQIELIRNDNNRNEEEKDRIIKEILDAQQTGMPAFVTWLRNYTDTLAGKKSISDRDWEHAIGRGFYQAMKNTQGRVAANMIALNPGSWATNLIPITQVSGMVSPQNLLLAIADSIQSIKKDDGFRYRSDFLTNRKGVDLLYQTPMERAQNVAGIGMEIVDNVASNVVTRALYRQGISEGMTEGEAMAFADENAAKVMADRSKGALPLQFSKQNPISKLFTAFQVEVNNQLSYYFKDLPRSKKIIAGDDRRKFVAMLAAAAVKVFGLAYAYNEIYERMTGRRAAFDPVEWVKEFSEDIADPNTNLNGAVTGLAVNVAEEMPFVGSLLGGGRLPISSALPDFPTTVQAGLGLIDGSMDSGKAKSILAKEFSKPLYYLAPPFAGGQAKKVVESIQAIQAGGSFGTDSEGRKTLQFPVENLSPIRVAQAMIFGKWSLPKAREYVDNEFKSLNADMTEKYQEGLSEGIYYDAFMQAYIAQKEAASEVGESGESVSNSRAKNQKIAIDQAAAAYGLSDNQIRFLYDAFGIAPKVWLNVWGENYSTPLGIESLAETGQQMGQPADPVEREIYQVFQQTKNKGVLPSYAERKGTTDNGEEWEMDTDTYLDYAQRRGQMAKSELAAVMQSPGYRLASPQEKSDVIERILDYAYETAKAEVGIGQLSGVSEKARAAGDMGISAGEFFLIYEAQSAAEGEKDSNGRTIAYTKSRNQKKAIDQAGVSLSLEQKQYLYELFGVSQKVW